MFEGSLTAIVTPMKDGAVDFGSFSALVDWQVESGTSAIVVCGTTGESPTLTADEKAELFRTALSTAAGRVPVIAGTGSNDTAGVIEASRAAEEIGVQGLLLVTPYYNKPNQDGLLAHYRAVADAVGIPIILYSVPGRTGVEIAVDTVAALAEHRNIAALKEAGGSVDRVSRIRQATDLTILSGDDPLMLPMVAVGAKGVVSVTANVAPAETAALAAAALAGSEEALSLHDGLYPLSRAMFMDTNPLPVKTALALMGKVEEEFRLPLAPMAPALKERLRAALAAFGLPLAS